MSVRGCWLSVCLIALAIRYTSSQRLISVSGSDQPSRYVNVRRSQTRSVVDDAPGDSAMPKAHSLHNDDTDTTTSKQSVEVRRSPQRLSSSFSDPSIPQGGLPGHSFSLPHHDMSALTKIHESLMALHHQHHPMNAFPLHHLGLQQQPQTNEVRHNEIRRAPVKSVNKDGTPRAHGLSPKQAAKPSSVHAPLLSFGPALPSLHATTLSPFPTLLPSAADPSVTLPPSHASVTLLPTVSFPTLPTISLPTFPTISLPTFPPLTLPPAFDRMAAAYTKAPSKKKRSKKVRRVKTTRRSSTKQSAASLDRVRNRLPKFIDENGQEVLRSSDKASHSWLVPFDDKSGGRRQ